MSGLGSACGLAVQPNRSLAPGRLSLVGVACAEAWAWLPRVLCLGAFSLGVNE